VVEFARRVPVAAIVGVDDSGTLLAARASLALGLPHNAPEAAERARDKHRMRCRFAAAGVPSPGFRLWHLGDDAARIAAATRFPCVVKPTTLSGSRGVMRANDPAELAARLARLRGILANERCDEVLVEDYVPGVEVALEGLLDGGRLRTLALFDKPDPLEGPFFEETLYVTPSRLPAPVRSEIEAAASSAAAALGLREGPVHAELRWNEGGPVLIEVAARSIGGLCSRTLRFGTDMSLEELILRQVLGLPIDAVREGRAGGVMMIPIPSAGHLRAVGGVDEASAVPGIEQVEITARMNHPLVPLPEGDSYLGFIFARGETPDGVEAALRAAHARLRFEIAAELPVLAF
jgi:biotin carboxylase